MSGITAGMFLAATAASTAIGAGASMYSARQGRKAMGQQGYEYTPKQYSFTEPMQKTMAEYKMRQLDSMSMGKMPAWYEAAMPKLRANMQRANRRTFFGDRGLGGGGGVMKTAMGIGAQAGLGPRKMMAQTNKALYDYSVKENEIDEYLTKLGVDVTMNTQGQILGSTPTQSGPGSQFVSGGMPNQYDPSMMNAVGQIGSSLGQYAMYKGMQNTYQPGVNYGSAPMGVPGGSTYGTGSIPRDMPSPGGTYIPLAA